MELIRIRKENEKEVVSARELHKFLEVKTDFKDWIKRKIIKYNFIENIDFILVAQKRATNNFKNPTTSEKDYLLTLDTAKEISMIENNAKGREARLYFIDCEKKYIENLQNQIAKKSPNILEEFGEIGYSGQMVLIDSILHNMRVKLLREKDDVEEKLRKLEASGLVSKRGIFI